MEYKTLADIRAARTKARQTQGNALANMTPGRGVVSAMGQLGGMLTDQTMGAFGQFTPEEMKASSLDKILGSRKGPPQTEEENTALVTELAQAGHAQEARQAMLNFQADKQSRLKTDEMEMKNRAMLQLPQLEAEWNYGQTGKNFYRGYAKKHFGIKDEATLATINSEDDLIMSMEQYTGGQTDSNSRAKYQKQLGIYDKAKKIAKDSFLGKKYRKDALGPVTKKLDLARTGSENTSTTDVVDPDAASSRGAVLGVNVKAGYTNTANIPQVDPNASALGEMYQKSKVATNVLNRVYKVRSSLDSIRDKTHTFEKNMPKDMLIRENKIDYIDDWLGRRDFVGSSSGFNEGFEYFMNHPKDLELFEKNPILWFFSKGPGKGMKDKQFSEHSYFGN